MKGCDFTFPSYVARSYTAMSGNQTHSQNVAYMALYHVSRLFIYDGRWAYQISIPLFYFALACLFCQIAFLELNLKCILFIMFEHFIAFTIFLVLYTFINIGRVYYIDTFCHYFCTLSNIDVSI